MSELAERFIASLIKSGDVGTYLRLGNVSAVFAHAKSDREVFKKFDSFLAKYGKIPEKETFEEIIGRDLPKAREAPAYYFDKLQDVHIKRVMLQSSKVASDYLREKDVQKAFDTLKNMVDEVTLQKMSPQIYDFRESHDVLAHELALKANPEYGIQLGWPTLDGMIGGLRSGDVLSFIGRPAAGKSQGLLYNAMHAWEKQKKVPLFISMEMAPAVIYERLAAMHQHIPYNKVKLGEFSTFKSDSKKKFLKGLLNLRSEDNPFWVIDGNLTASIQEIINICGYLKPDSLYVDGAYLVEAEARRTHDKIEAVCKGLKMQVATNMGIPVIASWQFNREATKLKKSERAGMQHIGGSDVIPQISTIALGMDQEESIETVKERSIRILKGRGGEAGQFSINWDWKKMDFSEIERIREHEIMIT